MEQLLETSHSYEDICTLVRHNGGECYEGDHGLTLFRWPRPGGGVSPLMWRDKPMSTFVINRFTLLPVVIGSPYIASDDYCAVTEMCIEKKPFVITELYDAREVVVFFYNGRWWTLSDNHFSLDFLSPWSKQPVSNLWVACLGMPESQFFSFHDPSYIYIYSLLNHEDRHVVDYTKDLGENYKYVILTAMRNRETLDLLPELVVPPHVTVLTPIVHADFTALDSHNEEDEEITCLLDVRQAGVRVMSGERWFDLHTSSYRLYSETSNTDVRPCGSEHYLGLYQRNLIDMYLCKFKAESFHTAPDGSVYQIKGLIDSVFKILTAEVMYLFKILWDVRFGTAREEYKDVYLSLPSEYKKVFYVLRGIYFSKKVSTSPTNKFVTMKTVYDMLKKTEPSSLIKLIQERKKILSFPQQYDRLYKLLTEYSEYTTRSSKVVDQAMSFIETRV